MTSMDACPAPASEAGAEAVRLHALRSGDEEAFRTLVDEHHSALLRLARVYVPTSVADEVVQETWAAVIVGLPGFEGRSTLRTWITHILLNQARTRGPRERRTIPFAATSSFRDGAPTVDPDRLVHDQLGRGYWPEAPPGWHDDPEGRLLGAEVRSVVQDAIDALPPAQREVIALRDLEGWTGPEVCDALGISGVNQRVLLHRARSAVRAVLEEYVHGA